MLVSWFFALALGTAQTEASFRMPVLEGAVPMEGCEPSTMVDAQRFCFRVIADDPRQVSERYVAWLQSAGFRIAAYPEADAGFINSSLIEHLAGEEERASYLASGRDDVSAGSINAINILDPMSGQISVVLVFETLSARRMLLDQAEPNELTDDGEAALLSPPAVAPPPAP